MHTFFCNMGPYSSRYMAASLVIGFRPERWQLVYLASRKKTVSSRLVRAAFRYTQRSIDTDCSHINTAWWITFSQTHYMSIFVCGWLGACSFGLHLHPIRASIRFLWLRCFRDSFFFLFFTTICCACYQYRPIIALILTMFWLFSAEPFVVKASTRKCVGSYLFWCPDGIVSVSLIEED